MEYGEAITDQARARALQVARELLTDDRQRPLRMVATQAVARAYCVCVTEGEDAAEHQFSQVHKDLVEELMKDLEADRSELSGKER